MGVKRQAAKNKAVQFLAHFESDENVIYGYQTMEQEETIDLIKEQVLEDR